MGVDIFDTEEAADEEFKRIELIMREHVYLKKEVASAKYDLNEKEEELEDFEKKHSNIIVKG